MDNKKNKRKKILRISGLIGLFLLVFGLSYALFTVTLNGTKKVKVKTGKLELQLLDANNNDITDANNAGYVINLDNQVPVDDETGLGTQAFEFKLKNNGSIDARYTIYLDDIALESGETRLPDSAVRYSLTKNGSSDNPQDLTTIGANPNRKLDEGIIKKDVTNTYTLKVWIDEEATNEAMDKVFAATLRVVGTQYVDKCPFEDGTMAATIYRDNELLKLESVPYVVNYENDNVESGFFEYVDDYNTKTWLFRGDETNNYVSFAGSIWRIIRIQNDGSVKLIRNQNIRYRIPMQQPAVTDMNWDYSQSQDKQYLDSWYQENLLNSDSFIKENDYCSDRYTDDSKYDIIRALSGDSSTEVFYGVYNRVDIGDFDITLSKYVNNEYQMQEDIKTIALRPSISCSANDIMTSKIALITADEVFLISSRDIAGTTWTMSPGSYKDGKLRFYTASYYGGAFPEETDGIDSSTIPVITLKANTSIASGDGTSEHPYVIE